MVSVLYYFQLKLLAYSYPVDTPETPTERRIRVIEGNQDQLEDKPPSGATLYNYVHSVSCQFLDIGSLNYQMSKNSPYPIKNGPYPSINVRLREMFHKEKYL